MDQLNEKDLRVLLVMSEQEAAITPAVLAMSLPSQFHNAYGNKRKSIDRSFVKGSVDKLLNVGYLERPTRGKYVITDLGRCRIQETDAQEVLKQR